MTATKPAKPPVVSNPSPNRGYPSGRHRPEAVVWHITEGTNSLGWLTSPASQASSNYLIDRDGTIHELVPPTESAWANGRVARPNTANPLIAGWQREGINFNQRTVSIEHEGFSSLGRGGALTAAQIESTAKLTAWLCCEFGIAPDRQHILGHFEIDDVDRHNCPGFATAEWDEWVGRVAALARGSTTDEPPGKSARLFEAYHQLPHWIVGDYKYEATADLTGLDPHLPADAQCLVCEKSVLWTDGNGVDAFHRGQYEALVQQGKVSEWR